MESIGEVLDSVKTYLKERLTNPLYGAFVASWAIVNFRLLLVFTGGGTWQEKITYIDTRLFLTWSDWCMYGYVYPFLAALTYMLLAPIVNRRVTVYLRQQDKVTIERLLDIEGVTPMTKPEGDQLRRGWLAERATRLSEQQASSEKLAELSRQIDLLSIENKSLKGSASMADSLSADQTMHATTKIKKEVSDTLSNDGDFELFESDFIGVDEKTVSQVVSRGLRRSHANGLHFLRQGDTKPPYIILRRLGLEDEHALNVMLVQLQAMNLIEERRDQDSDVEYVITSAGTQALDAILRRGYVPDYATAVV